MSIPQVVNILIRADASVDVGTGHIIRCLTLADELRQRGVSVSFACRTETGNLIEYIKKRGYRVYPLPADIDFKADFELTRSILKTRNALWGWLIIDHYGIDVSWESPLREFVERIMVIDDLANRRHNCDMLLDQNYNNDDTRYRALVPDHCIQLLGPSYALLRPQFQEARKKMEECRTEVKRIFIFMGGVDPTNATGKSLRAIKMLNLPDIAVDVVIGPANPNRNEIEKLASGMKNTTCHFGVENMAELMVAADMSIGAGGSTTWERSCLGLPAIVMVLSDDQEPIARHLDKLGALINLGSDEEVTEYDVRSAVEELISDSDKRRIMSRKSQSIVDCNGSERVASAMYTLSCD